MASQIIPIKIPTYISDATYAPARVLPRLLYYNGLVDCETYYIESGSLTKSGAPKAQNAFPYFDNYNVVTGSFPTVNSKSLLFNNEGAAYGEVPTDSLYTDYWQTYIDLLYNPTTRLFNCEAIIPLADYFKMELNDIVEWRGNYYHLRAINDYNLTNGECNLQLLGPILADALQLSNPGCNFGFTLQQVAGTTTTTTTTAGPTTTTTTTTAAPTTTTTTTVGPTTTTTTISGSTTTTTTAGTTTTTLAPGCYLYSLYLPSGTTVDFGYVPCATTSSASIAISANESYTVCIEYDKYQKGTNVVVTNLGQCTTTTIAPGTCQTWILNPSSTNVWFGNYVNCYGQPISGAFVDSQSAPFNNQICAIGIPQRISGGNLITSGSCTTTTSTTTTTTTLAPGCYTYSLYKPSGTTIDFGYVPCASTSSASISISANETYTLCIEYDKYERGTDVIVTNLGQCTTTTIAPGSCQTWILNPSSTNVWFGNYVNCYGTAISGAYVDSQSAPFNNSICAVGIPQRISGGNLITSGSCVTTTTIAPGCSTFVITNNGTFFTFSGDYVYCGNNFSSSYSVGTESTITLCVQDGKIDLPTGPNYVINVSGSCNSTTTTTTTLAPGCYLATIINNNTGTTFLGDYVYCGSSVSQSFSIASGTSASFCTQDKKIDLPVGPNYTSSFSAVGGCAATTTTTTTLAPGCYLATITNNNPFGDTFVGDYVYCGNNFSQSFSVPSGDTRSFCTQDKKIDLPTASYYTSSFSLVGGCAATTTTTTTLPPAFTNIYTADAWFDKNGFSYSVNYTGSNGLFTSSVIS
jgi:hypothetical protein